MIADNAGATVVHHNTMSAEATSKHRKLEQASSSSDPVRTAGGDVDRMASTTKHSSQFFQPTSSSPADCLTSHVRASPTSVI